MSRFTKEVSYYEVLWSGCAYDYSGYSKANREVLFRIANSIRVQFLEDQSNFSLKPIPFYIQNRIDALKTTPILPTAPFVRFCMPKIETINRYRICWTMFETQQTHPDFINRLNNNYDEIWTPTYWNLRVFQTSGAKIPISVVPLGVDPFIYQPEGLQKIPPCIPIQNFNITTIPQEFKFISIFYPTFRKGLDLLLESFEKAFAGRDDVCLILGMTTHWLNVKDVVMWYINRYIKTTKVYILSGTLTELQLASTYRFCQAYVSTSLGEGWNLPACEAAACGLPIIIPRNTGHLDFVDHDSVQEPKHIFPIDNRGFESVPGSENICPWFKDALFVKFDQFSQDQLISHFKNIKDNYNSILQNTKKFTERIRTLYTWDRTTQTVLSLLSRI